VGQGRCALLGCVLGSGGSPSASTTTNDTRLALGDRATAVRPASTARDDLWVPVDLLAGRSRMVAKSGATRRTGLHRARSSDVRLPRDSTQGSRQSRLFPAELDAESPPAPVNTLRHPSAPRGAHPVGRKMPQHARLEAIRRGGQTTRNHVARCIAPPSLVFEISLAVAEFEGSSREWDPATPANHRVCTDVRAVRQVLAPGSVIARSDWAPLVNQNQTGASGGGKSKPSIASGAMGYASPDPPSRPLHRPILLES
jgi:hypothetical protein